MPRPKPELKQPEQTPMGIKLLIRGVVREMAADGSLFEILIANLSPRDALELGLAILKALVGKLEKEQNSWR